MGKLKDAEKTASFDKVDAGNLGHSYLKTIPKEESILYKTLPGLNLMNKCCLIFLVLLPPLIATPAQAGLNEELSGMFNDMINVTPGGSYETQRRGVITGGNISMRNKVVHPNLISFVPPNFKGGCNGIDMFGGSFSYINSEQLTQLMRSIAQAAIGYAFQLAIEGMCPTCAQIISKLQKDIAQINALMRNSCEAGKWITSTMAGSTGLQAWHDERMKKASSINTEHGYLSDFFDSQENQTESPAKTVIVQGSTDEITGNVVYEALETANAISWFDNGDTQLKMVLMSLTGTLIIDKNADGSDIKYDFRPPLIKVRDFIEGGSVEIYKCESAECLLPDGDNSQTITFDGMRTKVRKMLWGNGTCAACSGGIVRKLANRSGGAEFSNEEKQFIQATSPGIYGLLRKLAPEIQAAALVAERMVDIESTELTNRIVDEMFDVVRNAVAATGRPMDSSMLTVMRDTRLQFNEERRVSGETIQGVDSLINLQQNIVNSMRTPNHNKRY
ncbi:conjugal transfer protein TraH [Methylicorpusculum oleiharenae]|uniref:conjugal transfer protein TraH n=1 Tax=Methylicorpusculum oleiharenae TaxID=1338687 RepID=UPI00135C1AF4|nr:conjugal transfer protein TraH [Methylicorpusculum oleiharenae]MCD2453467.1 conjugal transfer protein TraH [Methylicorpusculum oleiharenae]